MKRLRSLPARLMRASDRLLPALLMAASITLLAAGVLWYGSPGATGSDLAYAAAHPGATVQPQDDPGAFPSQPPAVSSARPSVLPSPGPSTKPGGPSASPGPSSTLAPEDPAVATRVVVPSLEIDLPIVSRDLAVPNQGPNQFPPCDVALYHTAFVQPGQRGTTYLYAHARDGMFLPLLTASQVDNGTDLIGSLVEVYTDDNKLYVYGITVVKRHATDFSLANGVAPGVSQLILQTSEGPRGTLPKLQVLAQLQDVLTADPAAAHPSAKPRACYTSP